MLRSLQVMEMKAVPYEVCQKAQSVGPHVREFHICAYAKYGVGACHVSSFLAGRKFVSS